MRSVQRKEMCKLPDVACCVVNLLVFFFFSHTEIFQIFEFNRNSACVWNSSPVKGAYESSCRLLECTHSTSSRHPCFTVSLIKQKSSQKIFFWKKAATNICWRLLTKTIRSAAWKDFIWAYKLELHILFSWNVLRS